MSEGQSTVDLLEQLRAALDDVEPLLGGRIVDIEMARLRVLTDPARFRREFASLIESAVADAEPTHSIAVRVARTGGAARIEVFEDREGEPSDGLIGFDDGASGARSVQRRRRLTCPDRRSRGAEVPIWRVLRQATPVDRYARSVPPSREEASTAQPGQHADGHPGPPTASSMIVTPLIVRRIGISHRRRRRAA